MSEESSVLLCDCACGGTQKLSLFSDDKRSFATKIGEVDAALCIRIDGNLHSIGIIEIEECGGQGGGFIPDRLFGKFMKASAGVWLSGPNAERIPILPGFFLQILNDDCIEGAFDLGFRLTGSCGYRINQLRFRHS